MSNPIDRLFATAGQPLNSKAPGKNCPSDEAFAEYLGALLPAPEREALELHSLACADCHDLLRMVVNLNSTDLRLASAPSPAFAEAVQASSPPAAVRIVGRLVKRGIELMNHAELTFRTLLDGSLTPAPIGVRGTETLAPEWVAIRGPGHGIDELELQVQTNGTARLVVRCENMPVLASGELASILLDVDGSAREKRPFDGGELSFAPIGRGNYRVRLVARAPGGPVRQLAEATLELTA